MQFPGDELLLPRLFLNMRSWMSERAEVIIPAFIQYV